jgi:hypothetical protein
MEEQIQKARDIVTSYSGPKLRIMEVCGTHTHEIFRLGISKLLPKQVDADIRPRLPRVRHGGGLHRRGGVSGAGAGRRHLHLRRPHPRARHGDEPCRSAGQGREKCSRFIPRWTPWNTPRSTRTSRWCSWQWALRPPRPGLPRREAGGPGNCGKLLHPGRQQDHAQRLRRPEGQRGRLPLSRPRPRHHRHGICEELVGQGVSGVVTGFTAASC